MGTTLERQKGAPVTISVLSVTRGSATRWTCSARSSAQARCAPGLQPSEVTPQRAEDAVMFNDQCPAEDFLVAELVGRVVGYSDRSRRHHSPATNTSGRSRGPAR